MTQPQCFYGSGCCWLTCLGLSLAWWLVAASLVWMTWNRVLVVLFKVKPAKLWHSLLLLATISVLALPTFYMKKCQMRGHHCNSLYLPPPVPFPGAFPGNSEEEAMMEMGSPEADGPKGDCPYVKHEGKHAKKHVK